MGRLIVNVPAKDVQADEIWGFVQKKESHKYPWEANDNSTRHIRFYRSGAAKRTFQPLPPAAANPTPYNVSYA